MVFTHGACTYFVDDLTYGEAIKHVEKVYGLEVLVAERMVRLAMKWNSGGSSSGGDSVPPGELESMQAEFVPGWGVDSDGVVSRYVKTDTLRHVTIETANKAVTLRSDVQEDMIARTKPLVQGALAGRHVAFPPTGFSFEATEQDGVLHGTIYHRWFGPIHITVTPPERDGEAAYLDVSITALLDSARAGTSNHDDIRVVGDLERCIAWAWLALHGYSQ